ncbi:MAG TPA: PilZ domain-containing protein, partial [Candidatus Polarisedimenticolaceae bacterium]|nr:PilZ domain-containing protein [Candidatus Polarisedimenticolaceae bacterium]
MPSDETTPSDHRASRFLAAVPAALLCGGGSFPCSAHDLSYAGTLLEGEIPIPEAPEIGLTLCSAAGDIELRLSGRVAHAHRLDDSRTVRLGVQFDRLDGDQREALERLLSRVVEGMAPAAIEAIDENASIDEIRAALALITTAHRTALASRCGPRERKLLRYDTDPHVLDGL